MTRLRNTLISTTLISASAVMSLPALSHDQDDAHNVQFCDIELNHTVSLNAQGMTIETDDRHIISIAQDGVLLIDGEEQSLTGTQQALLRDYQAGVNQTVPEVARIALDGVELAGIAIAKVSEALDLGGMDEVQDIMHDLRADLETQFYDNDTFVIDRNGLRAMEDTFDTDFENRMEDAMERVVMNSMGSLLMTVGSELISSGGDMQAFEARMEQMGRDIEHEVEAKAQLIEERADALCANIKQIAEREQTLIAEVPQLAPYVLFQPHAG